MLVKLKIDELDSAEVPIRVNTKKSEGIKLLADSSGASNL